MATKDQPLTEGRFQVLMGKSLRDFYEQVTAPVLDIIIDDIKDLKSDVSDLKKDVSDLKKNVSTLEFNISRMDRKMDLVAEITTDTRTNHERRIRVLEDDAGIKPPSRLTT